MRGQARPCGRETWCERIKAIAAQEKTNVHNGPQRGKKIEFAYEPSKEIARREMKRKQRQG